MKSRILVKKLKRDNMKLRQQKGDIIGFSQVLQREISMIIKKYNECSVKFSREMSLEICNKISELINKKFI